MVSEEGSDKTYLTLSVGNTATNEIIRICEGFTNAKHDQFLPVLISVFDFLSKAENPFATIDASRIFPFRLDTFLQHEISGSCGNIGWASDVVEDANI